MEQLLTGLKVLDLSRGMAGALCSMSLGDNGAEVIKLEPPEGDFLRNQLPHHVWNRNKRSAVCDLKTKEGQALFHKLAADADVMIESFRPGAAARLGVDYAELKKRYPRLVQVSITGFGTWGPQKDAPGYEPLVQAWLGLQSEQMGWSPGPHYAVLQLGSYGAGIISVTGALAALRARDLTGRGQHVETSLVDGVLALQVMIWGWAEKDPMPAPFNNPALGVNVVRRHMMCYGIIAAGDGKYFQMHSGQPGKFFKAMDIFGVKDKIEFIEPHLEKSAPLSQKDRDFLESEVPRIIKTKPRAEWIRLFKEADIVALEVDPAGALVNEPQVVHDKTIVEIDDPEIGKFKCIGPVMKCEGAPPKVARPAPRLGEHTAEVTAKGWTSTAASPRPPTPAKPATAASLKHSLAGVKIVDFGNYFAGPYASRMLSDLGADVIKVEPPSGDTLRPTPTAFRAAQRGKRSLALDLKTPEGKAMAHKLIQWADVVTHNMRADAADKLGIGFDEAKRLSPKVVYMHSAGFGATGPRAKEGAFAPLVTALCGLAAQAAGEGNSPVPPISNEDHYSGALGAVWLMMGLNYVARTGKPIKLNTSLLAATLFVTSELMLKPDDSILFRYALDKDARGLWALSRIYKGNDDRWACLVIEQEKEWRALTGVAGLEALGKDARFASNEARRKNSDALVDVLAKWFAGRSAAQAAETLKRGKVPAELVQPIRVKDHFFDKENLEHGRIVEYKHATFGLMHESGHVLRFSETPGLIRGPAPLIGEHSRAIWSEFGVSEDEQRALREKKVTTWPA
jgi:crotonobetainyl-CoA:carnitine CoA-transferase CaiB-like acyl-CoA transferase